MAFAFSSIRSRLDRAGIILSGLCAAHCLLTIGLISSFGVGSHFLFHPALHRIGLVLALIIAAVAIGWGALKHRRAAPFVVAMTGLSFMGGALAVPHGPQEAILTVIGVSLVTLGHILNLRGAHKAQSDKAKPQAHH